MDIGPIWRAMLRNKAGFILIALQMAVTLTILVNAFGIIQENSRKIAEESGVDEPNTFTMASVLFSDYEREQRKVLIDEDLDLIRNTPGVVSATASNSFPLRQGGWSMSLSLEPGNQTAESVSTAIYFVDEHGLDTFDVSLIDGENFLPEQITWDDPATNTWPAYGIVTEELAKQLFPDESVSYVGKTVFINDNESGLHADYERWLEELVPFNPGSDPASGGYLHNRTGEDNADAHHKRQIMGREVVVAITDGRLHLGPWEHIFYYEFDGRRRKRVLVKIIGE